MKRIFVLFFGVLPSAVLAHPGDHSGFDSGGLLEHFASQPDHVVIGLALVADGVVLSCHAMSRQ